MNGYTGSLLYQGIPRGMRPLGSHGRPAWRSHAQMQSLIRQTIRDRARADRAAAFFAVPVLEQDGESLSWYAQTRGMARAWADLSESERKRVDEEILVIRNDLTDLIKQMRDRAGAAVGLAEVIEQALERPGSRDSVYLVGDQPVSVFWGFQDEQIRPAAAVGDVKAGLPRWPTKQAAAPDPVAPDVVIAPVTPAPAEAPRAGNWRWLLWLLLGLMLLALLFYLLRGCDQASRASPEQTAPPLAAQEPIRPDSPLERPIPKVPELVEPELMTLVPETPPPSRFKPNQPMVLGEGESVQLAPVAKGTPLTATLEWTSAIDLDLHAIYRLADGTVGSVNFGIKKGPGIELDNDANMSGRTGRHREVITISDTSAFSEILLVANIFCLPLVGCPQRSFSEFDGLVSIRSARQEDVRVRLTSSNPARWYVIARITHTDKGLVIRNIDRVSLGAPNLDFR
jgi:uncharacterized protein involved in tellurium resistance